MPDDSRVRVEPVAAVHVTSLRILFEAASCPCFCRFWHFTGTKNEWLERCASAPETNAAELAADIEAGRPGGQGLVATEDDVVLGWMKLIRRDHVPKLRALPVYRKLDLGDDATTFSIACLLVHPAARGRGIARALVTASRAVARAWGGRTVEAYPRRSSEPLHPEEAWQGPEQVFQRAGFVPVHDVPPYPVYHGRV